MALVFLSYAREDRDRAAQLAEALEDMAHEVWWDRQIHGGPLFAEEIDRALRESHAVVVLWSRASLASNWVLDEAALVSAIAASLGNDLNGRVMIERRSSFMRRRRGRLRQKVAGKSLRCQDLLTVAWSSSRLTA